jgi:long-chain acyl-CoA synthetase
VNPDPRAEGSGTVPGGERAANEWHTPARYLVSGDDNATDDVVRHARERPDHPAFARKRGDGWETVTAARFADDVRRVAGGLMAAGVGPGDRVALVSATRYEWLVCDLAIMSAGAVTVPVYETSSADQVAWILDDSGATAVLAENAALAALVESVRPSRVRHGWLLAPGAGAPAGWAGLDDLRAAGDTVPAADVEARRRSVTADRLATVVYTSGTTGRPKGCMISHANLVAEVRNVVRADGIGSTILTTEARYLLFLPLAHVLARVIALAAVHTGTQLAFSGDLRAVADDLRSYRPTLVLAVPRVFEKLYGTARRTAAASGRGRVFEAAMDTAAAYSRSLDAGGPGPWLRLRHTAFERLVYRRLRAAMGGRVRHACSGGAPLGERLGHVFRGAGVLILEGYGMTETTAAVTLNLPDAQRVGSVGRPLPGCAVRIAADGEVLVRGGPVFGGYRGDDEATAAVLRDGWLHTGDLGTLDDGYLTITGRTKDIIVTAAGKNVAPAALEDRVRAHPLVDQCVLVGDRRPYIGALVVLDAEALEAWKLENGRPGWHGVEELRDDADLRAAVQAAVDDANRRVSQAEAIKAFRLVPGPLTIGIELTAIQKVRRDAMLAAHASEVEALYGAGGTR